MYYMATYYLKYCKFILLEAKAGNKLHKRLDKKTSLLRNARRLINGSVYNGSVYGLKVNG